MISLNRVTLVGRLGQDPEIRYLDNGVAVGRFSLATSERYKDSEGNWQERPTEWHNIVVWRNLAERTEKELKKGMAIYVEGQINYRTFDDKDGNQRKVTDILARSFRAFVDTRSENNNFPSAENDPFINKDSSPKTETSAPATNNANVNTNANVSTKPSVEENAGGGDEMGDDLPF
jgi:single-strand DNA-binding protein